MDVSRVFKHGLGYAYEGVLRIYLLIPHFLSLLILFPQSVPNPNCLDNQFYNVLLDGNQINNDFQLELQTNNGLPVPNQFLWRDTDQFMLNADIALAFNLDGLVNPTTGEVSCTLETCPESPLLGFAIEFSNSNTDWLNAFRGAFIKMTNAGCEGGACTAL